MKKTFLILAILSSLPARCVYDEQEIKIYRSVPSYGLLCYGAAIGPLPLLFLPSKKSVPLLAKLKIGALFSPIPFFIIMRQIHAYRMRNKPAIIINDEGIGCYNMWFRKDLFCKWRDVTSVLFQKGGLGLDCIIIHSTTHYGIALHFIELDFSAKKLFKIIKSHINF